MRKSRKIYLLMKRDIKLNTTIHTMIIIHTNLTLTTLMDTATITSIITTTTAKLVP